MIRILFLSSFLFCHSVSAKTLLILGDSLSAGYQMPIEKSWPALMSPIIEKSTPITKIVNASISGDTTGNGLARLPDLLKKHTPDWVLIELGANDGLRGFSTKIIRKNLKELITLSQKSGADVLLMQIQIPLNYGQRYTKSFEGLYPALSKETDSDLIPFFMEKVILTPGWLMKDGLHPTEKSQPWIAEFVSSNISPFINKQG